MSVIVIIVVCVPTCIMIQCYSCCNTVLENEALRLA